MKKEVNVAHVITTVAMVVSCFWFFSDLDKRIATNETEISHVKEQRAEDQKRIEKRLDSMDRKLDRLLEKK
jgi:peptidoglycan hydrolase CwlO-like protein